MGGFVPVSVKQFKNKRITAPRTLHEKRAVATTNAALPVQLERIKQVRDQLKANLILPA